MLRGIFSCRLWRFWRLGSRCLSSCARQRSTSQSCRCAAWSRCCLCGSSGALCCAPLLMEHAADRPVLGTAAVQTGLHVLALLRCSRNIRASMRRVAQNRRRLLLRINTGLCKVATRAVEPPMKAFERAGLYASGRRLAFKHTLTACFCRVRLRTSHPTSADWQPSRQVLQHAWAPTRAWQPPCSTFPQHPTWRLFQVMQTSALPAATVGTHAAGQPLRVQAATHVCPCILPVEICRVLLHHALQASNTCGSLIA